MQEKKAHTRNVTEADKAAAERLKAIWEESDITQEALAEAIDRSQGLVSQYMRGRLALNYQILGAFAKALNVDPTLIRNDLPEQQELARIAEDGTDYLWANVKAYAQAIGMGNGPEADEYAEAHRLKFRSQSLAKKRLNPDHLAVMYAVGDSMEPRIHAGDAILFDHSDTRPIDGKIYVLLVPGAASPEYTAKRCELIDGMVFFKADNPAGDHAWKKHRRMDSNHTPITIVGRVRWIGSWDD